ncbi:hypothetical protein bcere0024_01040 [Bacillus cereus Rock4-18]|nr:hypothetical protein bcere0024_01040 [Bacillus cereus Rock4-18]
MDAPESGNDLVYNSLKNKTYVDISPELKKKFQFYFDDVTVLNDFVIGKNIHRGISLILLEIMIIEKVFI